MKKLGLGTQELSMLRKYNCVYVDKTKTIYELITSERYCFLSRPRRFGKSLLVNTFKEIFSGNKDLFKETWIYDKYNFEKRFPIIKIDFSSLAYDSLGLEKVIDKELDIIATENKITFENAEIYSEKFRELIIKLSKQNQVVILVDEYDKPIIDYLDKKSLTRAEEHRIILKKFYSVIKNLDAHIRFLFITGVSRFSKVSLFSELNNLTDITIDKKYANIVGYSEGEIISNYNGYLEDLENTLQISHQNLMKLVKEWYNGYSWDGKNFTYNPYSVLNFLRTGEFKNFWFSSGTPTFLIKLIEEQGVDVSDYDKLITTNENLLNSYEITHIDIQTLLFQTGYLTIKEKIINPRNRSISYKMGYPNMEVRESFYLFLAADFAYLDKTIYSDNFFRLQIALEENNTAEFMGCIHTLFANIPSNLVIKDQERYYHTVIYLTLKLLGSQIKVEQHTNHGRIDAVIETNNYVYIMEFKMTDAGSALKQIKEKKYYEPYLTDRRKVICVGVAFDSKERNLDEYAVMELEEIKSLSSK